MLTLTRTRTRVFRTLTALGITAVMGLVVAACGDSTGPAGAPGMDRGSMTAPTSAPTGADHHGMPGMGEMATGDGLAADSGGFRFNPVTSSIPAGQPSSFQFRITGAAGNPVTAFEPDQTKLMHFYLIRSDLSGFQHVHPSMSADGTWTAPLAAAQPGTYRAYASFITKDATGTAVPLVLSQPVTVPGVASVTPLPAASAITQIDGYLLAVSGDQLMAGREDTLAVTVSKDGQPVTDLQPYQDTYAHLTAFHEGDLAFAHLHPHGAVNGITAAPPCPSRQCCPRPATGGCSSSSKPAGCCTPLRSLSPSGSPTEPGPSPASAGGPGSTAPGQAPEAAAEKRSSTALRKYL